MNNKRAQAPMKLEGSLRGAGALAVDHVTRPVSYQLDLYSARTGRSASGFLDGDLGHLTEETDRAASLRLADGMELPIVLNDIGPDGAAFEVLGAIPPLPAP